MKFELGDKVIGIKTGGLVPSIVIGIATGNIVVTSLIKNANVWEKLYPDWRDKPLYLCQFETPTRTTTLTEYKQRTEEFGGLYFHSPELNKVSQELKEQNKLLYNKLVEAEYYTNMPVMPYTWYTEEDLTLYKEPEF